MTQKGRLRSFVDSECSRTTDRFDAGSKRVIRCIVDFGRRAFAAGREGLGVVLIQSSVGARSALGAQTLDRVRKHGDRFASFVVPKPEAIRISILHGRERELSGLHTWESGPYFMY